MECDGQTDRQTVGQTELRQHAHSGAKARHKRNNVAGLAFKGRIQLYYHRQRYLTAPAQIYVNLLCGTAVLHRHITTFL